MKRKILFVIPILTGIVIGILIIPKTKEAKKQPEMIRSPVSQKSGLAQANSGSQSIENYIFSSQTMLTKAIEISKENKNDGQMKQRNEKIIELTNEAITTINQAISIYPHDPRPWAQRAKIYQTIKEYMPKAEEVALASWQKAIKLDPNNADYCQRLAEIYLAKGEIKSAVFYLEKAAASNPADPALLKQLAENYTQIGMLSQARRSYQKLLTITSNDEKKQAIKKEIAGLEKLIAQSTANDQPSILEQPIEIVLPDSPPLLEANHLAQGPIIASPEKQKEIKQEEEINSNALSGKGIIPSGQREVEICNDNLSPETQVYLVPETEIKNLVLMVKRKVPYNPETDKCSHFVAAIKEPLAENLPFRWWIIN